MALRSVADNGCTAFDRNRDGQISIDELVEAVSRALIGCDS